MLKIDLIFRLPFPSLVRLDNLLVKASANLYSLEFVLDRLLIRCWGFWRFFATLRNKKLRLFRLHHWGGWFWALRVLGDKLGPKGALRVHWHAFFLFNFLLSFQLLDLSAFWVQSLMDIVRASVAIWSWALSLMSIFSAILTYHQHWLEKIFLDLIWFAVLGYWEWEWGQWLFIELKQRRFRRSTLLDEFIRCSGESWAVL